MKVDPRHLPAVLAIAEQGSFARAAQALGVSQPALSKGVALLERRLGVRLFERGPKGASLTEAGQVVVRGARNLDAIVRRTEAEIDYLRQGADAPLTIGVSPSMMLRLVPDVLARLANAGLNTSLNVIEGLDDGLTEALREGKLDLVAGPLGDLHGLPGDLVETPLAKDAHFIGVNRNHRLADRRSVRLDELRDEAWILPLPASTHHRMVESLFISAGLPWPKATLATNSLHALERMIQATDRLCIISGVMVLGGWEAIKPIPLDGAPPRIIGVKQRRDHILPPYGRLFLDALTESLAGLDPP